MGVLRGIGNWFAEKLNNGQYYYTIKDFGTNYTDAKKLEMVLTNPAALFLFTLLPDLAAMGKYQLTNSRGDIIENHPLLDKLNRPNPMQSQNQFIWDYMFWRLLGTANLYINSKLLRHDNYLYWLSPDCIKWPPYFDNNKQTLYIDPQSFEDIHQKQIEYRTTSQTLPFRYEQLEQFFDISNSLTNWFRGPSRVDALFKVIQNSENSIDSKNITSHLARKYMVSGKAAVENPSQQMMDPREQKSIEDDIMSKKNVHAFRSMFDIKSFVNDAKVLASLDDAFMNDAFIIGKVLNIPKNVIELVGDDATHENQEKARAAVISYCIQGPMDEFCQVLKDYFSVQDVNLTMTYDHLPFVQVFEEQKASTNEKNANAYMRLVRGGLKPHIAYEKVYGEQIMESDFNDPIALVGREGIQNSEL